jgi:hypothetical protein|tara:strand:+ start:1961 stop:2173 length:213 start_codon:yes stop_codon:yes gene_type:complete
MITDIIKTAAAVADLLREEPRIALELKNHFDGEEDLLEALGLSKYAEQGVATPAEAIEAATSLIVAARNK